MKCFSKPHSACLFIGITAAIFLVASFAKLFDIILTRHVAVAMDLVLPFVSKPRLAALAAMIDAIELMILVSTRVSQSLKLLSISCLSIVFIGYKTSLLLNYGIIKCACFGGSFTKTYSDVLILGLPFLLLACSIWLQRYALNRP